MPWAVGEPGEVVGRGHAAVGECAVDVAAVAAGAGTFP